MTRNGKIVYWIISFILAFTAFSLRIFMLYPVFFILDVTIYYIIKSICKKSDASQQEDRRSDPPDGKR